MNKKVIGYWIATALVALAMFGSGMAKLVGAEELVQNMTRLGYPLYVMKILGAWYVLAAIALLAPGFPRIKEWAYSGIVIAMTGALFSHIAMGDPFVGNIPIFVILGLTATSYFLRPESRKLVAA